MDTRWRRAFASQHGFSRLSDGVAVGGGIRYAVEVPESARWIALEQDGPGPRRVWRLPIEERRWHPALQEATRLRATGDSDAAASLLRAQLPTLEGELAGRGRALLARLRLQQGAPDEAMAELRATAALARAAGRLSDWADDTLAVAHALTFYRHDLSAARALLDDVANTPVPLPAPGRVSRDEIAAWLAIEAGDAREALRSFHRGEELAARIGDERRARLLALQRATLLAQLGRIEEGYLVARALVTEGQEQIAGELPCNVAAFHHNLAWIAAALVRRSATVTVTVMPPPDPRALFVRARALYDRCPDPERHRHLLVDETTFLLSIGDLEGASALVDRLRTLEGGRSVELSVWQSELEGRLALARHRPALATLAFGRAAALARAAALSERQLDAQTGLGRARLAAGQPRAAVVAFQTAERLLDELLRGVPLGEGRDVFVAGRDEGARFLVQALVDVGRPEAAYTAARRARGRVLRAATFPDQVSALDPDRRRRWLAAMSAYHSARARLEAEAARDWTLPDDALAAARQRRRSEETAVRAGLDDAQKILAEGSTSMDALSGPEPDEAVVLFFPGLPDWLAFVARAGTPAVRVIRLPDGTRGPTAAAGWWKLVVPALAGAHQVRLLPHGAANDLDFHALAWPGGAGPRIAYGLDLPGRRPSVAGRQNALVVGDPTGDLAAARAEIGDVRAGLPGWQLGVLTAGEATRTALLAQLPGVRLFHYAGHSAFAGVEGLDSSLTVAGGERILATDVLALSAVPELVVLSACEGARAALAAGASTGLAQAFLLRGARAVIAPVRPVDDQTARAMMQLFYKELSGSSAFDPVQALQRAQVEVRRQRPSSDWASFRAIVP